MPTLTQIEYLLAVDEHRHFGRAARACFVSQPTLSMQVLKFESELGFSVFDRTKQPIAPTPEGKEILEHARKVLKEFRELSALAHVKKNSLEGEFRLGVIPTLAPFLVPRFLKNFSIEYPKIFLKIREIPTQSIIELLDRDGLDGALLATPLEAEGLQEDPLFYESFFVFLSPRHPLLKKTQISEKDLSAAQMWLLSEGHCLRSQILKVCGEESANASVLPNVHIEGGSLETVLSLVDLGLGYTLIPELVLEGLSRDRTARVRPIQGVAPAREVSLIYRRTQYKTPILEALKKSVTQSLPKEILRTPNKKIEVIPI